MIKYDSMIKKIPFIVCLTYCVAMEELLGKVPVLPAFLPPWGLARQGKAELCICGTTVRIFPRSG